MPLPIPRPLVLAAASCALTLSAPIGSQRPAATGLFTIQRWGVADGLPQATATAIAQDPDGFVVVSTLGGLCRFDGGNVELLDVVRTPGLASNRLLTSCVTDEGTTWVGTQGFGFVAIEGHRVVAGGLPGQPVFEISQDARGRMWFGTHDCVYVRDHGDVRVALQGCKIVYDIAHLPNGDTLVAARAGLYRLSGGQTQQLSPSECRSVAWWPGRDQDGGHVIVGRYGDLSLLTDNGLRRLQTVEPVAAISALLVTDDDALWLATRTGVARLDAQQVHQALEGATVALHYLADLPRETALSLTEDRERGVWAGFEASGIARIRRADLSCIGAERGLPMARPTTVATDADGRLLTTVDRQLYRQTSTGDFERLTSDQPVRSLLLRDSRGVVWADVGSQLCRLEGNRLQPVPGRMPKFGSIRTAVEMPSGGILVFGRNAITEWRDGKWHGLAAFNGLRLGAITHAVVAPDDAVWFGGPRMLGRLAADHERPQIWRGGDRLPLGEVKAILPERGQNAWVGSYGGGILRIADGKATAIDERHGLFDQSICAMVATTDDFVIAANRGIYMVHRTDAESVANGGRASISGRSLSSPGVHPFESNGREQRCIATVGDRIVACGTRGLYILDLDRLPTRSRAMHVHATDVFAGEQRVPVDGAVTPPVGIRNLMVTLSVCAFDDHPQTRFRWRVVGHRDEWSAPRQERQIRVEGLPPGEFVFEAEAVDLDGTTSQSPLRIDLRIPQRYWETTWFRIVMPIATITLLGLLIRSLLGRATRRANEIENRRQLERQLDELRRRESIGQLAGGIAHDFNNLLSVTMSSAELLELEQQDPETLELARNIVRASERGRSLTQHLLAVASRQVVTAATLDLSEVLTELSPVLATLAGDGIRLDSDPSSDPVTVRGSVTQVEQVLINLVANARDAMPAGGTIAVRVRKVGDQAELLVADDGQGMRPEVVEQAFEPFYSTKDAGIGRGLGLATVQGIARQLGGEVRIESEVGVGTTVRLLLPCTNEPLQPVAAPRRSQERLHGTVLLIEDEPAVRDVTRRVLTRLGCSVVTASDGDAAVRELRSDTDIDVVLSDVVMPGLQGRALFEALRAVDPDIPIAFATGYPDRHRAHEDVLALGLDVLPKPIDTEQLAGVLARLLPTGSESGKQSRGDAASD